jgi:hypothetical protein
MPSNLDHFKNQPKSVIVGEDDVVGLLAYKRALEKLFFSEVLIRNNALEGQSVKLLIELVCHFDLLEGVTHLKQGLWGQAEEKISNNKGSIFGKLFGQLQSKNNFDIEIEECSIIFNNCNVVIHKIYDQSIPEQFDEILSNLSLHYNKLFKNIAELPYEIFIPVLEETRDTAATCEPNGNLDYQLSKELCNNDYHKYWGLYFYSEQDALIYDLNQSSLISGNLYMLNL